MNQLNNIPLPLRIFLMWLVGTLIFFYVIYPTFEQAILENSQIFYLIFTLVYTFMTWKIIENETNNGKISKDLLRSTSFFIMLLLVLFNWDLLMFPYLITQAGILPNLSAGGLISSDIFIYKLLPLDIPEILKYGIVYCLTPALSFAIIAILAKKEKVFNVVTQRGF